jgi:hypothetical protein
MRTRAGKRTTKTEPEDKGTCKSLTTPKVQLSPDSANPPQLLLLPKDVSKEARIITLQNPRYSTDTRYLACPELGFYEFIRVTAPRTIPRSWLLSSPISEEDGEPLGNGQNTKSTDSMGYVTREANLLIATSIDPLFIILPALSPVPGPKASDSKRLFLSGDDYFDKMTSVSSHIERFLRTDRIRALFEKRMSAVCDTVDAGDETMFRLNEEKLLSELMNKARRMAQAGLPSSMEEKLVRKVLEPPMVINISREENLKHEEDHTPGRETPDTQTTGSASFSEASTATTAFSENSDGTAILKSRSLPPINAPDGVAELLRLRTAFLYICSGYVQPHITESLKKLLPLESSSVNFGPLDDHLASLAQLRQETAAARFIGDFSRKRALDEEEEDEEKRAEKRRREEEDKRKKANESRGVKALKKVNVAGMKKMSDFFKKK